MKCQAAHPVTRWRMEVQSKLETMALTSPVELRDFPKCFDTTPHEQRVVGFSMDA
jgi:hypothetical protein